MGISKNTEQSFFVLVRTGLWERDIVRTPFDSVDCELVFQLAMEQGVVGLVAAGLEHGHDVKVSQNSALEFVGQTLQIEQRNKAMNAFIVRLNEKLREAGINALLIKGQGIAQCYERPLWRTCGDVDLLLSSDSYEKAKALLLPMGEMTEPEEAGKKHFAIRIGQWVVELHGTLHVGLSSRVDRVLDQVQRDLFYGGKVRSWVNDKAVVLLPAIDEDVVYVFAHVLQHFYKGGIGLRQICDWCRLLYTYKESLDFGLLEQRIRRMGVMSEWRAFGTFAIKYIGMPENTFPMFGSESKVQNSRLAKKADRICKFIMEVGNFGQNREKSYYDKYPYVVCKAISAWWRVKDLCHHALIFPLDSLRFFPRIMFNGVISAMRGE